MKNNFFVLNIKKFLPMLCILLIVCFYLMIVSNRTNNAIEVSNTSRLIPIYSVETNEKKVAITFDCAWGAGDIPDILDTLERNDVKATFFVVGTWVDKFPDSVKLIAEAGHELGNHSNSHAHVNNLSYDANVSDMKKCNEKIEKITGEKVNFYRGPYGEYNNVVIKSAENVEMKVIQWDVDSLDYMGKTIPEMCKRIEDKIRNGSIILMHNDTENTAKGLQQIINKIHELGYEIVPLNDLIYHENYIINHEGRQNLKK